MYRHKRSSLARSLALAATPACNEKPAVSHLGGKLTGEVDRNFVNNRVLSPDEKVDMISTMVPDLARQFQAVIANPENSITYCYCSIFDECWLADSRRDIQNPEAVEDCPDFGDATFQN